MIEFFSLFMDQFHFLRPLWLLMLLPCITLVFLLWRQHRDRGSWSKVIAPALLPWLLEGEQQKPDRWPLMLVLTGWVITSLALAGPAWQKEPVPVSKHQQPWVVAVDLSYHMYAADLSPNRLTRVRFKLQDLFNQRSEGLSALVAYAGSAHTVAPLTDDSRTLNNLTKALGPDIMPVQGNNPVAAVRLAKQLVTQGSSESGDILLVTGSMTAAQAEQISSLLQNSGIRLSILGTGTEQGAPIPLPDGGYLKNQQGAIVVPQLEQSRLQSLARANGGGYQTMTVAATDLQALLPTGNINPLFGEQISTDRELDQWYDAGYWLVWLLLPAALLGFCRGWLVLIMVSLLPVPQDAMALSWNDLWLTRDQQGQKALQEENPAKAAELFENPHWKAQAQFENQDYQAAADTLKSLNDAESAYNRGNALAKAGKLEAAIDSYQKALDRDPNLSDTAQNLEKVTKDLQKKKREEQQQNQNGNSDGGQKDSDTEQQSSNKGQAGQQKASGNSADKDGQQIGHEQSPDGNFRQHYSNRPDKHQRSDEQLAKSTENQQQGQADQPGEKNAVSPSQQSDQAKQHKESNETREIMTGTSDEELSELPLTPEQQAIESWLRTIPDDPGGLLRRKFLHQQQSQQLSQQQQNRTKEASW